MTFVAGLISSGIILKDYTNLKMLDMILTWMFQALAIAGIYSLVSILLLIFLVNCLETSF